MIGKVTDEQKLDLIILIFEVKIEFYYSLGGIPRDFVQKMTEIEDKNAQEILNEVCQRFIFEEKMVENEKIDFWSYLNQDCK